MLNLTSLGEEVARRRKAQRLRQADLAAKAGVSRGTIESLENGRLGELGIRKVVKILSVLGLDLVLREADKRRPTLDDLVKEDERDQGLVGRR
jgi:transcriptional regulator with XRE-family HTH domain